MAHRPSIELILARQLASYLALPIFIIDVQGNLVFYNEPAEVILGRRFGETGEIAVAELASLFETTADDGTPLAHDDLPITIALLKGRPAHRTFWMRGLDAQVRHIAVTAVPLITQTGGLLGAVAFFWER
jgi:PAS domain-containing protein